MPSQPYDLHFMKLALEAARQGGATPGGAEVGCVLVRDGKLAATGFNEGELQHDPTAHAEMVTIRRLCAQRKTISLAGYTLYCTLQPCGMCSMACLWAGVSRIVYGAGRNDVNAVYFESRHFDTVDFIRNAFRSDLEIEGGLLVTECAALYAKPEDSAEPDSAHKPSIPAS